MSVIEYCRFAALPEQRSLAPDLPAVDGNEQTTAGRRNRPDQDAGADPSWICRRLRCEAVPESGGPPAQFASVSGGETLRSGWAFSPGFPGSLSENYTMRTLALILALATAAAAFAEGGQNTGSVGSGPTIGQPTAPTTSTPPRTGR